MNLAQGTVLSDRDALTGRLTAGGTGETSSSAIPSIRETLAVAPPASTSSRPDRLDRPRDRTRGHDDKKDGKK